MTVHPPAWLHRYLLEVFLPLVFFSLTGCSAQPQKESKPEEAVLSRTVFTSRVENYFEFTPLKAGKPSQFLIHLTDLSDGSPVEKGEVTLTVRPKSGRAEAGRTTARVGKVTGIYVADVTISNSGEYDIEFHVKNDKVDERLSLSDFTVK